MNAFLLALTFLTRVPIYCPLNYEPADMARSVLWYPFVGFLIGLYLVLLFHLLLYFQFPTFLTAAILLGAWVVVTGALHWDGLADSADAWLAGADQEKTLLILKDTHCGSAAVVIVGVCLIIFCASLHAIVNQQSAMILLLSPVLARAAAVLLMMMTTYVRQEGLGNALVSNLSSLYASLVLLVTMGITVFLLKWQGVIVLGGLTVLILFLRRLMQQRIGGITGDTIGALIVLSEMMVMLLSLIKI